MTGENTPAHLFVYGTLMRVSRSPYAQLLRVRARYLGEGWAPGRLYHLGAFPGAVFDEGSPGRVHGEVFRLNGMGVLEALDAYEGCDGHGTKTGNFYRATVRVALACGKDVTAWTYAFRGSAAGRPLIASGRYVPR